MQTISIDINKVQKGDETEFRLLFNLFYPRLMSVACRFVPEHIAEDIVQSVFVMYWEQKSALIPNAIHSFLYNTCFYSDSGGMRFYSHNGHFHFF